jgi:hypothetical protein
VLLLLADGHTYRRIGELPYCGAGFISGVVKHFRDGGVASILRESNGAPASLPAWSERVIDWLCDSVSKKQANVPAVEIPKPVDAAESFHSVHVS